MKMSYIFPIFLLSVSLSAFGMERDYADKVINLLDIIEKEEFTQEDTDFLKKFVQEKKATSKSAIVEKLEKNKFIGKNTYKNITDPNTITFELECDSPDNDSNYSVHLFNKYDHLDSTYRLDSGDRLYATKPISAVEIGFETPIKRYVFNNANTKKVLVKTATSKDPKKPVELTVNKPSGQYVQIGGAYGKLAKVVGTAITKSGIPYQNVISEDDIIEQQM